MHRVLIVFPLLLLFSLLFCCVEAQQWSTVTVDNKGDYSVNSGLNSSGVAWGYFTDDIATDGWAKLYIESNKDYTDSEQMFGAGYLEGVLTRQRITYYKTNFMANQFKSSSSSSFSSSSAPPPPTLVQFALDNLAWSRKMAASYQEIEGEGEDSDSSYYWWHVARVLDQFDGLLAGYNQDNSDPMTLTELLLINLSGDLDDLQNVFPPTEDKEYLSRWTEWSAEELENRLAKKGRCSSIVKVTPDLSDLMIAHTTWGSYWTMQRIWKTYNFKIQNSNNSRIAFSGYPGILVSFDDYFILQDTNLVVTETTNDVVNITLYENNINVQSVMYWIRAFVASRMATTSKDWVDVFSLYNSGTYNNQWIVLDYKLFVPGTAIVNNTLWIVEQMPGAVYKEDVSHILQYGYWPSYNRPYFQQVYDAMGYTYFTSKYGDMFSYQLNPRANIFRRDQGQILTIEDMMHFMQYNSYKTDPLASGYPGSQISSRFDLKGGPTAPVSWFTFGAHGGVDSKITNAAMAARSEAMVISGPTYQDPVSCPPFTWADWPNISHVGLPEVFNFTWILVGQN